MGNSDESFLERIISNITDSGGGELLEYCDYDEDKVKELLTDSFKKGGNEELIKELETHNFFIVWRDDDHPSNSSLVADLDWCVFVYKDEEIEEYTFIEMEFPEEFKIYVHKTSLEIRHYSEPIAELIDTSNLNTEIGTWKAFEKTVTDYMINVFWYELDYALDKAEQSGELSKDFDMDDSFRFEGIEIPQDIKDEAYRIILKKVEENPQEEEEHPKKEEEEEEPQYEGEVNEKGQRHGKGTITWSNGDKYEGEWKHGKEHGRGTYTWSDGDVFLGKFKDWGKNGQGEYTCSDGRKFVGEWKDFEKRNIYVKDKKGKLIGWSFLQLTKLLDK